MSMALRAATPMAFGVDPTRRELYSLRQARYQEIGDQVGRLLSRSSRQIKLLDVGVWNGVSMRYLERQSGAERIEFHGIDLKLHSSIYNVHRWASLREGDLLEGFSHVASEQYDVVVCEQVLEHLPHLDTAISTLCRVLKPGGTLIVGVPIFPLGVHLLRKHLVPLWDRMVEPAKVRGHLQAFSLGSFVRELNRHARCHLDIRSMHGFRVISGGLLRPLENTRWWWQFGRITGRLFPGLCTEVQVVAVKGH